MNDLETIDSYFAGRLPDAEKARFEQQIVSDPDLAEAVAFYLQAKQTARAGAVSQPRPDWEAIRQRQVRVIKPAWAPFSYAAAASVLLVLGFFLFRPQPSAEQLADQYIRENLTVLSMTMGSQPDSLQRAKQAYNEGRFADANTLVSALQQRDTSNAESLKIAGLVSIQQGKYDQAIDQFHRLSQRPDLYANPGLFYEALAHLKRNQPNDKNMARTLLKTVITNNLEGRKAAEGLVKALE